MFSGFMILGITFITISLILVYHFEALFQLQTQSDIIIKSLKKKIKREKQHSVDLTNSLKKLEAIEKENLKFFLKINISMIQLQFSYHEIIKNLLKS